MRSTVLVTDRVGTILHAYGGSGRPLGYEQGVLEGRHGIELVAPEDHAIMASAYDVPADLPIAATPAPFPLRMIGPDGHVRTWDCAPGGFDDGERDGWIITLTCRTDQNPSITAMDSFIAGGSPHQVAMAVAERLHGTSEDGWRKTALVLIRDVGLDGTLGPWTTDAPAGSDPRLLAALDACVDEPAALWNALPAGAAESNVALPPVLRCASDAAGLGCVTARTVGLDGDSLIVFLRLTNYTPELQINDYLADNAVAAVLQRSLEARRAQATIDLRMRSDELTGTSNRLHFDELVAENAAASDQAVLFVDLDDFKSVNDEHGHAAGDEVLREVASRIQRACRLHDSVCRVGGDEFAIVLRGVTASDVHGVAHRIQASMAHPLNLRVPGPNSVSVTIGTALPQAHMTLKELVNAADMQMLERKSSPRRPRLAADRRSREPYAAITQALSDLVRSAS